MRIYDRFLYMTNVPETEKWSKKVDLAVHYLNLNINIKENIRVNS